MGSGSLNGVKSESLATLQSSYHHAIANDAGVGAQVIQRSQKASREKLKPFCHSFIRATSPASSKPNPCTPVPPCAQNILEASPTLQPAALLFQAGRRARIVVGGDSFDHRSQGVSEARDFQQLGQRGLRFRVWGLGRGVNSNSFKRMSNSTRIDGGLSMDVMGLNPPPKHPTGQASRFVY